MSTPHVGWRANDLAPNDIAHLLDRFIRYFKPGTPEQCWLWEGSRVPGGYGILPRSNESALFAHRVSWVAFTGQALTNNITIDHLCFTRLCVNPGHLEPVSLAENLRRAMERHGLTYTPGGTRAERTARAAQPASCESCGKTLQRGHLRRHARRFHEAAA